MTGTCAGKLNKRIVLETNTPAQDGYGEPIEAWSAIASVWAEKMSAKASERFRGEQLAGYKTIVWRIRYRTDVDNLDRVTHDGQNFGMIGVTEEGNKDSLILITKAILDR